MADLREVRSHPVALAQCKDFFAKHPHIRLVESEDTAASAAWVAEEQNPQLGAIASSLAGEIHGLQLLAEQGVNLTKIQSVPLPEHPWEYQFFLDFAHDDLSKILTAIDLLKKQALNLRVLGVYKSGFTYE